MLTYFDTWCLVIAQADTDNRRRRPEDSIPGCHDEADKLEDEFAQPALQDQLLLIVDTADRIGKDNWPQALWRMPAEESKPIWDAMRVRFALCSSAWKLLPTIDGARSVSA